MNYVKYAQNFISKVEHLIHVNINVMNDKGIIIASTDMERIGDFHALAYSMIKNNTEIQPISNVDENPNLIGVKPGINILLKRKFVPYGVIGLTGNPEEITELAKLSLTAPSMFKQYIQPVLKEQSDIAHSMGKFLATHTDGENTGLLPLYAQSGFDIADSICPAPMTRISLADTIKAFDNKITIWGGIPSTSVLKEFFTDKEFEKLIDDTFSSIGRGDHMILSIADTVPPAADFNRILYIQKKAEEFGAVKI